VGWYDASGAFVTKDATIRPTKHVDLVWITGTTWRANFDPISYYIHFDANVPTGQTYTGTMRDLTATYDQQIALTDIATGFARDGYRFTGWNVSPTGSGTTYTNGASVINLLSNDGKTVTLYAQWEAVGHAVTYDVNNGETGRVYSPPSGALHVKGDAFTVAGTGDTEGMLRRGYTFDGWNTAAKRDSDEVEYAFGSTFTMPDEDVILYAHWTPVTYTVEFYGGAWDATVDAAAGLPTTVSVAYGDQVDVRNRFVRAGNHWVGWRIEGASDESLTGVTTEAPLYNLTYHQGATVRLYALWDAERVKVEFASDGKGGSMGGADSQTAWYGGHADYSLVDVVPDTGYYLSGWTAYYTDGEGVQHQVTPDLGAEGPASYQIIGPTVFIAHWSQALTVTYQKGVHGAFTSGSADDAATEGSTYFGHVAAGAKVPAYAGPSNGLPLGDEGWAFAGWDANGDGKVDYKQADLSRVEGLTVTEPLTFVAIWTSPVNITVSFDANNPTAGAAVQETVTGTMPSQGLSYGTEYALAANTYRVNGYRFAGWNTQADGKGTPFDDLGLIPVAEGDALDALERVVQIARLRGRRVDADADERIASASSENISVIGIVIGNIQPLFGIIVPPAAGRCKSIVKAYDIKKAAFAGRDVHYFTASSRASTLSVSSQRTPRSVRPM